MKFLYAAYAVTWIIHLVYLGIIARGYSRVREDIRELEK